ncbi:hypothetical protein LTR15_006356 [Elasticomyces elasticus]|nr:hypothetical protein LTR15_006356 [Elasticomyces elasticus]
MAETTSEAQVRDDFDEELEEAKSNVERSEAYFAKLLHDGENNDTRMIAARKEQEGRSAQQTILDTDEIKLRKRHKAEELELRQRQHAFTDRGPVLIQHLLNLERHAAARMADIEKAKAALLRDREEQASTIRLINKLRAKAAARSVATTANSTVPERLSEDKALVEIKIESDDEDELAGRPSNSCFGPFGRRIATIVLVNPGTDNIMPGTENQPLETTEKTLVVEDCAALPQSTPEPLSRSATDSSSSPSPASTLSQDQTRNVSVTTRPIPLGKRERSQRKFLCNEPVKTSKKAAAAKVAAAATLAASEHVMDAVESAARVAELKKGSCPAKVSGTQQSRLAEVSRLFDDEIQPVAKPAKSNLFRVRASHVQRHPRFDSLVRSNDGSTSCLRDIDLKDPNGLYKPPVWHKCADTKNRETRSRSFKSPDFNDMSLKADSKQADVKQE